MAATRSKRLYPITVRFRASKKEVHALARLAKHFDREPSGVLRQLIREADERRGATEQPKE